MTTKTRDQVQFDYIAHLLSEMSMHDLRVFFVDTITNDLNDLGDAELIEEVHALCPELV